MSFVVLYIPGEDGRSDQTHIIILHFVSRSLAFDCRALSVLSIMVQYTSEGKWSIVCLFPHSQSRSRFPPTFDPKRPPAYDKEMMVADLPSPLSYRSSLCHSLPDSTHTIVFNWSPVLKFTTKVWVQWAQPVLN